MEKFWLIFPQLASAVYLVSASSGKGFINLSFLQNFVYPSSYCLHQFSSIHLEEFYYVPFIHVFNIFLFQPVSGVLIEDYLELVLLLPDPGRALVLLGCDGGGKAGLVDDVEVVIAG